MSVFIKTVPQGIDEPIQALQTFLYAQLKKKWKITNDTDFNSYGRVYRNQNKEGYTPEAFTGANEYTEVYFDDTLKVLSFFSIGESEKYSVGNSTLPVSITFLVSDVTKLKPNLDHRGDEEIILDVQRILHVRRYGFTMTGTDRGIDNVFKDYSGWRKSGGIKYRDEQPWLCFKINTTLLYALQNC